VVDAQGAEPADPDETADDGDCADEDRVPDEGNDEDDGAAAESVGVCPESATLPVSDVSLL
jgi:hypothetical protein